MTRLRLPPGLHLEAGIYDFADGTVEATFVGLGVGGQLDYTMDWKQLREVPGVEIECDRHPDQWWSTAGKGIPAEAIRSWRCPDCAWSFRQKLGSTGGTPQ